MKVSIAQISIVSGDVAKNRDKILEFIEKAKGSDIVTFPEMSDTGYHKDSILKNASETGIIPDIQKSAKENRINVVIGVCQKIKNDIYNSTFVIDKLGNIINTYQKTHLITAKPFAEYKLLKAGNKLGLTKIENTKCGLIICYEIRFPEITRTLALKDTKIIFITSAWPKSRLKHWENLIISRAIENQIYIVATNRTGSDAGIEFAGHSMIIDPFGNVLKSLQYEEDIISANLDLDFLNEVRSQIKVFEDRRPTLYEDTK